MSLREEPAEAGQRELRVLRLRLLSWGHLPVDSARRFGESLVCPPVLGTQGGHREDAGMATPGEETFRLVSNRQEPMLCNQRAKLSEGC